MSTPWYRSTRSRDDCTVTRQPTEHVVHVDSSCSRSHGPRLEPVRLRCERADRADLHGVAGEVRRERRVGEREHLRLVAPSHEADQRIAGDLAREAGAAIAEDAALAIEEDEVADRDRLLEVTLLLDEAALAGTVRHRLVLQRALAALVAHGAVERVVDQQELEDAVLRLLHRGRGGVHDHAVGGVEHARDLQRGATRAFDLDEAHAAHADRRHPRVVAEARDVDAVPLRRRDDELARLGRDRPGRRRSARSQTTAASAVGRYWSKSPAEPADDRRDRRSGRRAERADRRLLRRPDEARADVVGDVHQQVDVGGATFAGDDADAGCARATWCPRGRACTCRTTHARRSGRCASTPARRRWSRP